MFKPTFLIYQGDSWQSSQFERKHDGKSLQFCCCGIHQSKALVFTVFQHEL